MLSLRSRDSPRGHFAGVRIELSDEGTSIDVKPDVVGFCVTENIVNVHPQPGKLIFGNDGSSRRSLRPWEYLERRILGAGPADSSQPFHQNFALCFFLRSYISVAGTLQDSPVVVQHAMQN